MHSDTNASSGAGVRGVVGLDLDADGVALSVRRCRRQLCITVSATAISVRAAVDAGSPQRLTSTHSSYMGTVG